MTANSSNSRSWCVCVMACLLLAVVLEQPVLARVPQSQHADVEQAKELVEDHAYSPPDDTAVVTELSSDSTAVTRSDATSGNTQATPAAAQASKTGTFELYGFAMLDAGYDFNTNDPDWFDVVRPSKLPAFAGEFAPKGKFFASVRQTRFGVKASTPTPFGDLKTIFEFELFGTGVDAGQTTFRLRHAYGELGHIGAGQTWSAFMDIGVFPNSIEYWGPNGMVFFRNIQVRLMPISNDDRFVIALERPGASGDGGVYADRIESLHSIQPHFQWPDLTGHARFSGKWGYVQIAGLVRKIAWVDTSGNPINLSGKAYGVGGSISSNINITKRDVGKFEIVYGQGIENYMNDAPLDIGVRDNVSNTSKPIVGVALPVLGVVGFIDHTWSLHFTSSAGYSLINITNSDGELPSDLHQGDYALANLLYHPTKSFMMGGEFQFGRRVNFSDGFNVNDYRIQISFKYDFSKGLEY